MKTMNATMDSILIMVFLTLCTILTNIECYIIYKGEGDGPCKEYKAFKNDPERPCSNLTVGEDKCLACKGHYLMEAVIKLKEEKVESLLNNTDVAYMVRFKDIFASTYGFTSLTWAANKNLTNITKMLLEHKSDVNHLSEKNYSPLYFLAKHRNTELVDILLTKGADPNAAPMGGDTPLLNAAKSNYYDIAKSLLDNSADPNYMTSATHYSSLYFASKAGNTEMVNELLYRNALVNLQTTWNITALMIASAYGHKEIVQRLLNKNADPNLCDNLGYTALHKAAYNGYDAILKSLLEKDANINALDSENKTALHYSAAKGWETSVTALLESCPDDKIEDANGQTALDETLTKVDKLNLNPRRTTTEETEKFNHLNNVVTQLQGYTYASCQ